MYEAFRSQASQRYPEFELLFGVSDLSDPAGKDVERLAAEFPERRIRLVLCPKRLPNGKVGVLAALAAEARYPVLVVSDSDITAGPDYLQKVVQPLEDLRVGVVTCLYRARSAGWLGRWEALGIATEFAPSVLVSRALGMAGFALGSTMVMRAAQLREIGGFESLGSYLADDYQLGRRMHQRGLQICLADEVVETQLGGNIWRHQLRWARTIRVSHPAGYYGYIITQATFWAILAGLAGFWKIALGTLAVRIIAGVVVAAGVLRDRESAKFWFLIPLRDLWGLTVWVAGLFGKTVEWRGEILRLSRDGQIESRTPPAARSRKTTAP